MKQSNLLLILVLAIVTISSAFAAKPKAKHVIWIGLDGWGEVPTLWCAFLR